MVKAVSYTHLMCFQSLILDMAGNVGTQSLAVTIRVLVDENLTSKQKRHLVGKEMLSLIHISYLWQKVLAAECQSVQSVQRKRSPKHLLLVPMEQPLVDIQSAVQQLSLIHI